jgi:hypothetical protein
LVAVLIASSLQQLPYPAQHLGVVDSPVVAVVAAVVAAEVAGSQY